MPNTADPLPVMQAPSAPPAIRERLISSISGTVSLIAISPDLGKIEHLLERVADKQRRGAYIVRAYLLAYLLVVDKTAVRVVLGVAVYASVRLRGGDAQLGLDYHEIAAVKIGERGEDVPRAAGQHRAARQAEGYVRSDRFADIAHSLLGKAGVEYLVEL